MAFSTFALLFTAIFYFSYNAFEQKVIYVFLMISFFSGLISLLAIFVIGLYRMLTIK